jgi:phospholipid/cholesterol/gamma-HCH transport system substrate-binding protein
MASGPYPISFPGRLGIECQTLLPLRRHLNTGLSGLVQVKFSRELKVGGLTLAAALVLYFGIDFLKGADVFNPSKTYFVRYENVDGLTSSNPIMLNGLQVGLVKKIRIQQGQSRPVVVQMEINKEIMLGKTAKALLSNNGLLGGKMIVLDTGDPKNLLEGDTLTAEVAPGFTSMLEDKAQPMVNSVQHLVKTMDELVESFKPTVPKLNSTLESVDKLALASENVIGDSRKNINEITGNLNKLSASLLETEKQLKVIMTKVGTLGDSMNKADLAGTIHSLHRTTDQLNKTMMAINQGQGTMGKLVKNDSLYRNLNASSAALNALLVDFKANPKRYVHFSVFGAKEKKSKEK